MHLRISLLGPLFPEFLARVDTQGRCCLAVL